MVLRAKIGCFCFFTMGVHYENIKMTILGTKMPYLVGFGFYYGARLISDHCSRYRRRCRHCRHCRRCRRRHYCRRCRPLPPPGCTCLLWQSRVVSTDAAEGIDAPGLLVVVGLIAALLAQPHGPRAANTARQTRHRPDVVACFLCLALATLAQP